jgi:hypothetical protein
MAVAVTLILCHDFGAEETAISKFQDAVGMVKQLMLINVKLVAHPQRGWNGWIVSVS